MKTWTTQDYVYVTAECLVAVLAVLDNGLVLMAIYRIRALRTVTNCFIASLAAADMLVGAVIPPAVVLPYRGFPHEFYGCVVLNSAVVLITNISILSLLAVAMERFLAISDPFRYRRVLTKKRALLVVALTWVVAIFVGLIPTMGWNLGSDGFDQCSFDGVIDMSFMVYLIFFAITLPPLFFMLIIYLYIFHIIRKQQSRMVSQMPVLSRDQQRSKRQQKQEMRGSKWLAYVIILFALCWMPLHVCNCIKLFDMEHSPPRPVLLAAIVLSHANSFINPFLYAFRNSQFKCAMKRIIFSGRVQPSYSTDSGLAYTRTIRGSTTGGSTAVNGYALSNSLTIQGAKSSGQGNGVVNEAFNREPDVSREVMPEVSVQRQKSLRWNDEPLDGVSLFEDEHTAMELLEHIEEEEENGPHHVSDQVWVTPSSRSVEFRALSQAPLPSSPSQKRYEVAPSLQHHDEDVNQNFSDQSVSMPALGTSGVIHFSDDADCAQDNVVRVELEDVTNDATDDITNDIFTDSDIADNTNNVKAERTNHAHNNVTNGGSSTVGNERTFQAEQGHTANDSETYPSETEGGSCKLLTEGQHQNGEFPSDLGAGRSELGMESAQGGGASNGQETELESGNEFSSKTIVTVRL
ncbi:adenosine receptor A2a-like [Littorina saxatilis]|uniref:adenosine receptor A2a-like n=1 Tax=Littorina saxatilis TaxID=31220 RepID=UPI0038B579F9